MKKRILSLLAALALCLSLLPTVALADEPTGNWTDNLTSQPNGYTVDDSGNVSISSAEGLAWLAKQSQEDTFSGKTVTLTADINLSDHNWTPIGPNSSSFSGTFDGQNHTITGLTIDGCSTYAGLFANIYGGTVENVQLAACSITSTSTYTAGICGLNSYSTIENCHILSGSIHGSQYTGGICGSQLGYKSQLINCSNAANVSGSGQYLGGVCGHLGSSNSVGIISGCTNSGAVTATGGQTYVGGV